MLPKANTNGDTHQHAHGDIHQRIAELARTLHNSPEGAVDIAIERITGHAAREVPGAQYAGVTLATSHKQVESLGATHPYPALLDEIQQRHGEGPCLSAAWTHHTVRVDDLTTDERWPRYRDDALERTPIRSLLSFRLFVTEQSMGALNLYAERPNAFDDESEEIGYVLATHTALALDSARQARNFRSALASRDVIGQAKGIIMARFDINAVEAFELLRRLSQESNTKLVDVAHRIAELRVLNETGRHRRT
jgi:transcriptional regulator with GAF, ATPase, and Fis domain